jgi:2-C-methyl-D-erythritol 4-phosphate cytidylyltransferase
MSQEPLPSCGAVIVGGGSGTRFGGDKLSISVAGKPLIAWTLLAFEQTPAISSIVLVIPEGREDEFRRIAQEACITKLTAVLTGGSQRHESVLRGLHALPDGIALAAIHDAARPLITPALITRCLDVAVKEGASSLAAPVTDTLHETDAAGSAVRTIDRSSLHAMQTPQVFRAAAIRDLLDNLNKDSGKPTDEVSVALAAGWRIPFVVNLEPNPKVTWPHDLVVVKALLSAREGHGVSK